MKKKDAVMTLPISVVRTNLPSPALHPFMDYFRGFENVEAVRSVFGEKTEQVLRRLKIGFISNRRMYMGIRDSDGNLSVGAYHLKHSDKRMLYLDIVHELFHVKQFMNDRAYFRREHQKFMRNRSLYYASPIEVPAYYHTVREAEKIGMPRKEIVEYLKMGPAPPKIFANFVKEMEIGSVRRRRKKNSDDYSSQKINVRIIRNPPIELHPFKKYFKGFENVPSIRALFGGRTEQVLDRLLVEFVDLPFRAISPSDYGGGDIVVGIDYFRHADLTSLYLDVFLCLNMKKKKKQSGRRRIISSNSSTNYGDFRSSPSILESYRAMIKEARRLGVSDQEVLKHLELPRFLMSPKAYDEFLKELGLSPEEA